VTDAKDAAAAEGQPLVTLTLPTMPATVAPLVYAVPVQLTAYHTAVIMGMDVDQPCNLTKSERWNRRHPQPAQSLHAVGFLGLNGCGAYGG
jgi:glucosamine 6-phosphate synthetase-like amidotransferase/phosphosugar isomerase protein